MIVNTGQCLKYCLFGSHISEFIMSIFFRKPDPKEQVRQTEKTIRQGQRGLQRDRLQLEREEKKLEDEIKKAAKQGNKQVATILAKQLVALRKQKTKTFIAGSKMQAIGTQTKLMHSNMKMADAMATTTKTMGSMNKAMDPMKTAKVMQDFERQNAKMEMTEEMINDTLDDMLEESGDESEEEAIVNKVLDEIGIEITGKLAEAPSAHKGAVSKSTEEDEIEKQLSNLKAL